MIFELFILSAAVTNALSATNCYGDISKLRPTGKAKGGVVASQADVKAHLTTLKSMKSIYERVANKYCVQASVIAGIASRESNGGDSLASDGTGDKGKAWGIMQCDLRTSGLKCKSCPAKSECHIDMMVKNKLISDYNGVTKNFPSWTIEQRMQGAVAAYNFGLKNVRTLAGLDKGTTNNDYSNDVIARAQYLKSIGMILTVNSGALGEYVTTFMSRDYGQTRTVKGKNNKKREDQNKEGNVGDIVRLSSEKFNVRKIFLSPGPSQRNFRPGDWIKNAAYGSKRDQKPMEESNDDQEKYK